MTDPTTSNALMLGVAAVVIMAVAAMLCWANERRWWANGRCRRHGLAWYSFDRDSQGGRGYKCGRGCCLWLSWFDPSRRSGGK